MRTKHTKGEWIVGGNDNKSICVENKLIVTCWSVRKTDETRLDGESWLDMRKRTENDRLLNNDLEPKANAKLIAAAPDLLEACKLFIENGFQTPSNKDFNILVEAVKKATE